MAVSRLPASKRTIMVVDDSPDLVEILRITLKSEGFNVRCVYSGKELLAALEKEKPNLILLDIMMPQMEGLEVLRCLKDAPETSSIPVIMLTVLDGHEDIVRAYNMGADFYIPKPFTKKQLLDGVNSILS